ncbi:MAG TPA: transaldolase [Bacteroidota bacterium]|jgi:transaldolase
MNALQQLDRLGQSIWFDNISRSIITGGTLSKLVGEGLQGVTSNPTIFDKAISGGHDYDDQIRELVEKNPGIGPVEIEQELMIRDIQMAADVLKPVFARTGGRDGYVSVEVNPHSAHSTGATIEEVRFFWTRIARANLMVKIPATKEGLPAIEQATSEGININVTLIFSEGRYREVAEAYLKGLERRVAGGGSIANVVSVASVFVSRVDTLVDDLLAKKIAAPGNANDVAGLRALLGKTAVANSKFVYQAFKEIFRGGAFETLRRNGARVQRPLWGSTGTKNPAYGDLKYVEDLVGPDTVNTVPPKTYEAILDHLKPALTIEQGLDDAAASLRGLSAAGIDLGWVMQRLEDEGVAAFEKSFDDLSRTLLEKQGELMHA